MADPALYALPPGVDFPAELVAGLLGRMQGQPPEALARVTHRVVCLVGLDERSFPRRGLGDGDDLLARDPAPGDPDHGTRRLQDDHLASRHPSHPRREQAQRPEDRLGEDRRAHSQSHQAEADRKHGQRGDQDDGA